VVLPWQPCYKFQLYDTLCVWLLYNSKLPVQLQAGFARSPNEETIQLITTRGHQSAMRTASDYRNTIMAEIAV